MRLRWTVVTRTAAGPTSTDVVVRCPGGTTLGEVLDRLAAELDNAGLTGPVEAGGSLLGPDAVVGVPPLLDGAVVSAVLPGAARTPRGLLELVVRAGPDAGTVAPVPRRATTVGRAPDNDVVLRDPRLSRRHCVLSVATDGVHVVAPTGDGGHAAHPVARVLGLGEAWRAGAGLLVLRTTSTGERAMPVSVVDRGDGTREVRPPPRPRTPEPAGQVRLPAPARAQRTGAFPLLAVALPALAAGGLAWWTGSVVYLALAAVGPLLVGGSWWTARREARREGRLGRRAHARACAALQAEARVAATTLAEARSRALPDAVSLLEAATGLAAPLWERHHDHDDALRVRLGTAAGAPVAGGLVPRVTTVDHAGAVTVVATEDDLLAVDLREGPLGVVEPTGDPACARFVVGQLVALLPPPSLAVVPLVGGGAASAWRWLHLLPHLAGPEPAGGGAPRPDVGAGPDGPLDGLRLAQRLVDERAARARDGRAGSTGAGEAGGPPVLVVVDDPDGEVDAGELQRLCAAGALGVHVLVVARSPETLPRGCTSVLVRTSPDGVEATLTRPADGARASVVLDTVDARWATRLARALAPLRLAPPDRAIGLPPAVRLDALLDLRPDAVARRWSDRTTGLPVPLGVGPDGPVVVDLVRAGPHALVAGTTGSGKSELLRTWLLALAATRPPDRLALLLVDYKGGATFDDLAALPHCVGLLTDLDGGATARVLHSLRAEVRRRERLFAVAGARDLSAYQAAPRAEAVPRLLVVVDEFRVLAEDAPEVLGRFVRLAATGRSLGIHLVLATQRPGGVVSADIRANAGLRVALRVQDAAESRDVVERPDAAWLPSSAPGRAVVVGADLDVVLQTAWTGGGADVAAVSVTVPGQRGAGRDLPGPSSRDDGVPVAGTVDHGDAGPAPGAEGGAAAVVAAIIEAARRTSTAPARAPWSPPLPAVLRSVEEAVAADDATAGHDPGRRDRDRGRRGVAPAWPGRLVLGVADLPWEQSRRPLAWEPLVDGPLLVTGAGRSGRTTTLATAAQAARAGGVPVVRLSGAAGHEDHLVDALTALAAPPPAVSGADPALPRVLVLLDDADDVLDPGADPTAADLLLRLVRSGHRSGVGLALAGGRTLATSRLAGGLRARLVHRTADRSDALLAGLPVGVAPLPAVPGRAHALGLRLDRGLDLERDLDGQGAGRDRDGADGTTADGRAPEEAPGGVVEVQVLLPYDGARDDLPPRPRASADLPGPAGWVPAPLPRHLVVDQLADPRPDALALGRTGPGDEWVLDPRLGGLVVVAGPAGSGRTTTLQTVAAQADGAGLCVATLGPTGLAHLEHHWGAGVGPSGAHLVGLPADARPVDGRPADARPADVPPADARPAGDHLVDQRPVDQLLVDVLLVDDADRLDETTLTALEQWLQGRTGPLVDHLAPGATVVVAGTTAWFADRFTGLPALARQAGRGVVLWAGRTDVRDVLGVRGGPVQQETPPGRGLAVQRGQVVRVQVALARPSASGRSDPGGPLPSSVMNTGGPTA